MQIRTVQSPYVGFGVGYGRALLAMVMFHWCRLSCRLMGLECSASRFVDGAQRLLHRECDFQSEAGMAAAQSRSLDDGVMWHPYLVAIFFLWCQGAQPAIVWHRPYR